MIDLIKRILVTIVTGVVIIYTGALISASAMIVQPEHAGMNFISILAMLAIAIYMMIVYGIYPLYHPMQKRTLPIVGLATILFGQSILANDYNTGIYAGDIMKIFGAMILWFGATGLLTSKKVTEQKK